jgi:hypothetical protein
MTRKPKGLRCRPSSVPSSLLIRLLQNASLPAIKRIFQDRGADGDTCGA